MGINNTVTVAQYAKELQCSRQHINQIILRGELPKGIKKVIKIGVNRKLLVKESDKRNRVA